jgi:hypothetical protein
MSRFGTCLASLFALTMTLACGDDEGGTPTEPLSFAEDVHPILLLKCAGSGCHSDDTGFQPGHAAPVASDAYMVTQRLSSDGVPVYERILARTSGMDPYGFMPPTTFGPMPCQGALGAPGCLTVAEYALIEEWVAQGAPP